MIRVSIGTACVLELKNIKMDVPPETAYFMVGEGCKNNCAFCNQASGANTNKNLLSRVTWPSYAKEKVLRQLISVYQLKKIKRACFQLVYTEKSLESVKSFVQQIRKKCDIPISISGKFSSLPKVSDLINLKVDNINIALDAVTNELYSFFKGDGYHDAVSFLERCAKLFPSKISTHLIVGLGETEEEMCRMINRLYNMGILAALFAFTPLKNTKLGDMKQPPIESYRKMQLVRYLIYNKFLTVKDLIFKDGKLKSIKSPGLNIEKEILKSNGEAFKTSGCEGCNRPFYNERPNGVIYNYPRNLEYKEILQILTYII